MLSPADVRIGTSGWCYKHWRNRFYPRTLRSTEWFAFYAQHFDTVELNATFYRLPERRSFENWRAQAPAGFVYAVKASRFLTHLKRLSEPEEPLERLLSRAGGLGSTLGPILYQLPPQMQRNDERLEAFLKQLPRGFQHTLEFRHASWHVEPVFTMLRRYGVALCIHDWRTCLAPIELTADFAYIRLHGSLGPFIGSYGLPSLRRWRDRIAALVAMGAQTVYVYFNNDGFAYAVKNALRLKQLVAQDALGQRFNSLRIAR